MPVRLGISPIGWSNDDLPELGGDTPLETCLTEARLAGFEGIELGNKFPRDPAVLRPMLERYGLSLISGWYSGRLLERSVREELAEIEAHRVLPIWDIAGSLVQHDLPVGCEHAQGPMRAMSSSRSTGRTASGTGRRHDAAQLVVAIDLGARRRARVLAADPCIAMIGIVIS
jgi:inosose dehydratase